MWSKPAVDAFRHTPSSVSCECRHRANAKASLATQSGSGRADASLAMRGGLTPRAAAKRLAASGGAAATAEKLVRAIEAALDDIGDDEHRSATAAAERWLPLASEAVEAQAELPPYASFAVVPDGHPWQSPRIKTLPR